MAWKVESGKWKVEMHCYHFIVQITTKHVPRRLYLGYLRRYADADVLGLSDWPRYPDSGLAEPKGNKLHDLR